MTSNADILQALAALGSVRGNYQPQGKSYDFSGYGSKYKVDYAKILKDNPVKYSFKPSKKDDKKKSKGLTPDIWAMLSGTLGLPGGLVTDSVYNTIDKLTDKDRPLWKKLWDLNPSQLMGDTLLRTGKNMWNEQVKDWTDGKVSWGDVPLIGALHGADKGFKRGMDLSKDFLGTKGKWSTAGIGIGIDIAADPLTYLTGGASMAGKMGKAAELTKIGELASEIVLAGKVGKTAGLTADEAAELAKLNKLWKNGLTRRTWSGTMDEADRYMELKDITNAASSLGKKFKNTDEFLNAATDFYKAKYAKYQHLSEHVADKAVAKKIAELSEKIKTARNTTYNANINKWGVSVPFSNKMTAAMGDIKEGSLLHRTEATLGSQYKHLADDLLNKVSMGDDSLRSTLDQVLKVRYGVDDVSQLTKTQFDDLTEKLAPVINQIDNGKSLPEVRTTQQVIEEVMPQADFDRLMDSFTKQNIKWKDVKNQLDSIMAQVGHDPKLRASYGSHLAEMVSNYWKTKPAKNFSKVADQAKGESMEWASKFLKDSDTYKTVKNTVTDVFPKGSPEALAAKDARAVGKAVTDMVDNPYNKLSNAKTKFEHWLDKKGIFNARSLATGDKFLDSMGNHIADANSRKLGETAMYDRGVHQIEKFIKKNNVTEEQMKNAIYHLEGKAPDSYGKNWVPSDVEKRLANKIKPLLDEIASDDMAAGTLSKTIKNYFPHVVNKSEDDMKALMEFDTRHPELNGLGKNSKFDQERKSFKTIADRDNYVVKLAKLISKETDQAAKAALEEQLSRVENMFDTDVVSAITRRIREGVRSRAMKEMQGNFEKYGMMKTLQKGETPPSGLVQLDASQAKKLGLGEGKHYMHPEVLKGIERVDEIFTNQGMNKAIRHLAAISDIWRPLVTYYKPSHYINNWIGNSIINMAAGVKVSDYKSAYKLYNGYKAGTLTEAQMKIMKAAYKHNVVSGGFLFDSKSTFNFKESTKLEKVAKAVGDNKAIRKARQGGEVVDDISRLANFMNGLNKFGDVGQAAKQVRTYLFNYNELTNADRFMRTMVPFWNWTKRNIPLQMKLLMEQPKFAMNNERFRDLFNYKEDGEDWQKESGIKVPFTDRYTNIPSPVNDLTLVNNPMQFLGGANPALKMGAELGMNKKFYTGKPISYGSDNVKPEDYPSYIAHNLGIGGNLYDLGTGKDSILEFLANLIKPSTEINPVGRGGN